MKVTLKILIGMKKFCLGRDGRAALDRLSFLMTNRSAAKSNSPGKIHRFEHADGEKKINKFTKFTRN